MRISFLPLLLVAFVGCAVDAPADDCEGDRCEAAGSRDELLAEIEGFHDPVAELLRVGVAEDGTLAGDYRVVLDGVGTQLGCDETSERSFVVLSNQSFVPKPIVTRCAHDATSASQLFMAMVGSEAGFDARATHIAAWDSRAGVYRRYATAPAPAGGMAINVAPGFCMSCHGGPEELETWQPLMNEMTSPWAGWNSEPGFSSVMFSEYFDPRFADDPTYRDVTRAGTLAAAADFEPVVRAAVGRVASTRLKQRTEAARLEQALELLRPLYCDESLNYVSEVHASGELRTAAFVDDAIRSLYRSLAVPGDWGWLANTRMYLPPSGEPITLVPVRGEATIQVELGLVARGVLAPLDALRVRALDWHHPAQSELRCDLYREARARVLALETDGLATTEALLPLVYREIMKAPDGSSLVDGPLYAIPDARDPAAAAAFVEGSLANFATTPVALGDAIEARVTTTSRSTLATERNRRACLAVSRYPTAPLYPDLECSPP